MVRFKLTLIVLLLGGIAAEAAEDRDALYRATAIVTGQGVENRQIGFRLCFLDVLVKLSGDQRLLDNRKTATFEANASQFVEKFSYRDLLEGVPIHDEQGTHDRPHYLTADFKPEPINAALDELGSRPWLSERPKLLVLLGVRNAKSSFVLAAGDDSSASMRESFTAAAERYGVPIAFAETSRLGGLTFESLAAENAETLAALAHAVGADLPLVGSLVWSDAELGWIADWRLVRNGTASSWQIRGISFDDAFRDAIRGSAQVLSGNGSPGN